MNRIDGRNLNSLRPVKITRNFTKYAEGSVLIEMGGTKVIVNASIEENVPPFKKGSGSGWITAEYSMLPRATIQRNKRDISRINMDQRSAEIKSFIGRALRAAIDLKKLGERTIIIDCDVIQADGGTRAASITGGFVALTDACKKLVENSLIYEMPLITYLSAVSVGIVNGESMLDLCYEEDAAADVSMNIVMTGGGDFVEIQVAGKKNTFTDQQLLKLLEFGKKGTNELFEIQIAALSDVEV